LPTTNALKLRVQANRLSEIDGGRRAISAETALRLGCFLDTGAAFRMSLQSRARRAGKG
jgi:plasmid maintenance system antidote protein VapI